MKIFSLKNLDTSSSVLIMTLEGVAKWLKEKEPVGDKFYVASGICGEEKTFFDITAENLRKLIDDTHTQCGPNFAPSFFISRNFFVQTIDIQYVLGTVDVIE